MDEQGQPSMFHEAVTKSMAGRTVRNFNVFESVLVSAGRAGGTCVRKRHKFKESRELHTLRLDRRCARTVTVLIQLRHKQELRAWKTWKVNTILPCKTPWKHLPGIQAASHRTVSQQPEPNKFADMLEELLAGDLGGDLLPTQFTEIAWEKGDVYKAIKRMKLQKSADECGLIAEVLKYVPDSFIDTLVVQFNDLMRPGYVPTDWRKTSFKMLPKTIRAKVPSRLPPDCNHTTVLQTFCIHDFGPGGKRTGNASARRTTWFSGWQTCGRTFGDYALGLGQIFQRKRANLDCQPGLVKGFRPSTLASTMPRSFGTRPFRTHDLDDPKFISRPTGTSCWQQWLQWVFCYTRLNTTRMRFKPPAVLFGVGNVDGELA